MQDLSAKLQKEYEEKLLREQQKHREEIEKLQVGILIYFRYCNCFDWITLFQSQEFTLK